MNNLKGLLDLNAIYPFWLINKERAVPSYLGAISTLLAFILAFFFA